MRGKWERWKVGMWFGAMAMVLSIIPSFHHSDIHSEYVKYLSGRDTVTAYIAYPERPQPAPAVIVIHEIFGMSDFIRQTTEQLAKDGFVAIAPDLLSRRGGTPSSPDSARKLIATLNADTVTADLNATRAYLKTVKAARSDDVGVIGFCWGGGQSFPYAGKTGSGRQRVERRDPVLPRATEELAAPRLGQIGARPIQRRVASRQNVLHPHIHRELRSDARWHELFAVRERIAGHCHAQLPRAGERQNRRFPGAAGRRFADDGTAAPRLERHEEVFSGSSGAGGGEHHDGTGIREALAANRRPDRIGRHVDPAAERISPIQRDAPARREERPLDETSEQRMGVLAANHRPRRLPQIEDQTAMAYSLAGRIAERAIELREDIRVSEGVHAHPDHAVGERVGFERGAVERRAAIQRHAARDAHAAFGAPGEPQQQMQRRAALSFEHLRDGTIPAAPV